jgi:hypothetical protein
MSSNDTTGSVNLNRARRAKVPLLNLNRARKGGTDTEVKDRGSPLAGSPLEPQPSPKGGTDTEVKDRGSPLAGSLLERILSNLLSAISASLREPLLR